MATKRSCCMRFSCFSSASSDEKGQDPTSTGTRSWPSAIDNTIETLPGAPKRTEAPISGSSNVVSMKYEIEHVDVNLNVSGTHQCDKAPVSESLNLLRKCEGKNVNVNFECTRSNEASSSGSSNVSMKYEGEDVDANPNVSEAPWCDEDPSFSSSRGATKSDVINTILHKDIEEIDGKKVDVNLDNLMEHISELLTLREEKDVISGPVTTFLKDIEQVSVVTTGLLVVAYNLERFDDLSTNKEKCSALIKEMSYIVTLFKRFKESPKGMEDVIQDATALIVEGAYSTLVLQKDKWPSEAFEEMRYVFAYDVVPLIVKIHF